MTRSLKDMIGEEKACVVMRPLLWPSKSWRSSNDTPAALKASIGADRYAPLIRSYLCKKPLFIGFSCRRCDCTCYNDACPGQHPCRAMWRVCSASCVSSRRSYSHAMC